jgi:hypothetical protein
MTNTIKVPQTPENLFELLNTDTYYLMKFSTSWCKPCKDERFLTNYSNMKNKLVGYPLVKFMELVIDKEHELVAEDTQFYNFDISSIPCLILFHRGRELARWCGTGCLDEIEEYIRNNCN